MAKNPKSGPIPKGVIDRLQSHDWQFDRVEIMLPTQVAEAWEKAVASHPNGLEGFESELRDWLLSRPQVKGQPTR